jgi:hypothetical protein
VLLLLLVVLLVFLLLLVLLLLCPARLAPRYRCTALLHLRRAADCGHDDRYVEGQRGWWAHNPDLAFTDFRPTESIAGYRGLREFRHGQATGALLSCPVLSSLQLPA